MSPLEASAVHVLNAGEEYVAASISAGDSSSGLGNELGSVTSTGGKNGLDPVGVGAVRMASGEGNTVIVVRHLDIAFGEGLHNKIKDEMNKGRE